MTRELELAYAAGLFDGEGCIGIYVGRLRMQLVQANPDGPRLFHELFGGSINLERRRNQGRGYFAWNASKVQMLAAIRELLPFLREKRKQAEMVLEYAAIQERRRPLRHQRGKRYTPEDQARLDTLTRAIKAEKWMVLQ